MSDSDETGALRKNQQNIRWWEPGLDPMRVSERLICYQRYLAMRQDLWRRQDIFHATLYSDAPVSGLGPFSYMRVQLEDESARLNLVKAACDSWVAAMTKNSPLPMCLTQKGDWGLKRRGKRLNQWLEATFDEVKVAEDLAPFVRRLAAIFGTGLVKVFEDVPGDDKKWEHARVGVSAVFPWEITIDDGEAQDPRNIRNLFYDKWYDVDELIAMFPKMKAQILDAPRRADTVDGGAYSYSASPNLIKVTEGYHLRSSATADDGLRAVCIPNACLGTYDYTRDRMPFAVWRRAKAPMGWRGIGLAQELRGMQCSINEIMLAYEEAIVFYARPKWMAPRGAEVQRSHVDDQIGTIIEFDGPIAPTMYIPNAVMPTDVREMIFDLWQKGFEQPGISSLFAGGQVPTGLKSGEAIRRYNDTGQARAVEALKLDEAAHVELGELMIDSGREIAKHNPKFCSMLVGKRTVEMVYFKKVDPGRDKFSLRVHPTSGLSSDPAEKLEQLDMLANHNPPLIDEHTYRLLLEWPDIDQENAQQNAPFEIIDAILERIYDADNPEDEALDPRNAPDPDFMPLDWMAARLRFARAMAFLDDAEEDIMSALATYGDVIQATAERMKPPAMPAGAPPPPQLGPAMPPPIQQGPPQMVAAGQAPPMMGG
jgi:hypothetical protein